MPIPLRYQHTDFYRLLDETATALIKKAKEFHDAASAHTEHAGCSTGPVMHAYANKMDLRVRYLVQMRDHLIEARDYELTAQELYDLMTSEFDNVAIPPGHATHGTEVVGASN